MDHDQQTIHMVRTVVQPSRARKRAATQVESISQTDGRLRQCRLHPRGTRVGEIVDIEQHLYATRLGAALLESFRRLGESKGEDVVSCADGSDSSFDSRRGKRR